MASGGHHLLESTMGPGTAASPEASQGIPTPTPSLATGEAAPAGRATIAAAADRVAPLSKVQAIFSERKDDLNLALDEMKDKVTNLMNAPGKDRALNHPFPVRVLKGEKVQMEGHEAQDSKSRSCVLPGGAQEPQEDSHERSAQVREHACWLWSRLGVSLMSLTDRNVWLEEENKRLQQELESLEQQIHQANQQLNQQSKTSVKDGLKPAPSPLEMSEEMMMPATESQMTPSQMATSPSQRVQRGGPAPTQTLPPNRP